MIGVLTEGKGRNIDGLVYLEGTLPAGMELKGKIKWDIPVFRFIREVEKQGGHVVVVLMKADAADIENARTACKEWQEERR